MLTGFLSSHSLSVHTHTHLFLQPSLSLFFPSFFLFGSFSLRCRFSHSSSSVPSCTILALSLSLSPSFFFAVSFRFCFPTLPICRGFCLIQLSVKDPLCITAEAEYPSAQGGLICRYNDVLIWSLLPDCDSHFRPDNKPRKARHTRRLSFPRFVAFLAGHNSLPLSPQHVVGIRGQDCGVGEPRRGQNEPCDALLQGRLRPVASHLHRRRKLHDQTCRRHRHRHRRSLTDLGYRYVNVPPPTPPFFGLFFGGLPVPCEPCKCNPMLCDAMPNATG